MPCHGSPDGRGAVFCAAALAAVHQALRVAAGALVAAFPGRTRRVPLERAVPVRAVVLSKVLDVLRCAARPPRALAPVALDVALRWLDGRVFAARAAAAVGRLGRLASVVVWQRQRRVIRQDPFAGGKSRARAVLRDGHAFPVLFGRCHAVCRGAPRVFVL